MAAGEGVEPSSSGSKPDVLPVTPPAKTWVRRLPACCLLFGKSMEAGWKPCVPRIVWSRWKELNRHRSIIDRVLWPLSYTASLVDPTGLKPAPHGLKGRRSVTRAPGQQHFQLPIFDCRL